MPRKMLYFFTPSKIIVDNTSRNSECKALNGMFSLTELLPVDELGKNQTCILNILGVVINSMLHATTLNERNLQEFILQLQFIFLLY